MFLIDIPYSVDDVVDGHPRLVRVNGCTTGATSAPLVTSATARLGLNPCPAPSRVRGLLPWGTYLGDDGVANGVS